MTCWPFLVCLVLADPRGPGEGLSCVRESLKAHLGKSIRGVLGLGPGFFPGEVKTTVGPWASDSSEPLLIFK